jgi:DMSO/TMAO reductase YedYZ heme-binding membrane subunit
MRRDFGEIAEIMLLGILFLSPLSQIFRTRLLSQCMGLRRELGIFMAYLSTVHGVGYLIDPEWMAVFVEPYLLGQTFPLNPTYALGGVAYLLTLPLLFTSNTLMQRFLHSRNWKRLHRLAYVVLVLVLLHHFSINGGMDAFGWLQIIAILGAYIFMKLLAWKKDLLPPLNRVIGVVATRYHDYEATKKKSV